MGTSRHVKLTDISSSEIKEVLNSQAPTAGTIPETDRVGEDIFTDNQTEGSPAIYEQGIDSKHTERNSDGTLKSTFTSRSFKASNWKNYGWSGDPVTIEETPEIYWKSVVDFAGIDHIPANDVYEDTYIPNNYLPGVTLATPLTEEDVNQYTDDLRVNLYNLANESSSIYYRDSDDDFEKYFRLNVKAGVDYPKSDYNGDEPEFEIKVTPLLGDGSLAYNGNNYLSFPSAIDIPYNTIQSGILLSEYIAGVFNYFNGPLPIFEFSVPVELINGLLVVEASIATIIVADIIWDYALEDPKIPEYGFQYKNIVSDIYNFLDIYTSEFKFGFGNKNFGYDAGSFQKAITEFGESFNYKLTDYNYEGTPFSPTNLISEFPTDSTSEKYINMSFFPKGSQYDLETPPPIVQYLVELIPIKNCKLSTTKPTKFMVKTCPHRYLAPLFDVKVPSGLLGREGNVYANTSRIVYKNSPVNFINAKWCDFVGLLDTENQGLFTKYTHLAINGDGGSADHPFDYEQNKDLPYIQSNISGIGTDIFRILSAHVPESQYKVFFYKDQTPQLIKNPYFRLEGIGTLDTSNQKYFLRKYWDYSSDWDIRNGAIYRDVSGGGSSYVRQELPKLDESYRYDSGGGYLPDRNKKENYYFLDLDVILTTGTISLTTGADSAFYDYVYTWTTPKGTRDGNTLRPSYGNGEEPSGITYGTGSINFTASGRYKVLVLTRDPRDSNEGYYKGITFVPSVDFTGRINNIKLQKTFNTSFTGDKRGGLSLNQAAAINGFNVQWTNELLTEKSLKLYPSYRTDNVFTASLDVPALTQVNAEVNWGLDVNFDPIIETFNNVQSTTLNLSRDLTGTYNRARNDKSVIIKLISVSGLVEDLSFSSLTCDNTTLYDIIDAEGILYNADIDLSNSGISYTFSKLPFLLNSLDISGTNSEDNTANLAINSSIVDSINIDNTNVYGSIDNLITIPNITSINSKVNEYSGISQPDSQITPPTDTYSIIWKNSDIPVTSLNKLVLNLDFSAAEDGYLDIKGTNPDITDETALENIDNLVTKGWTVLYNEAPVVLPEVTIGTQTWTSVNLDIDDLGGGIYAYDDDEGNVVTYGRLYTWAAALRVAGNTSGWHLPAVTEWDTLINFISDPSSAGGSLKEIGITHWDTPNTGASDNFGFTALPGGNRATGGIYAQLGIAGIFWTQDSHLASKAWTKYVIYNNDNITQSSYPRTSALQIRLIKN